MISVCGFVYAALVVVSVEAHVPVEQQTLTASGHFLRAGGNVFDLDELPPQSQLALEKFIEKLQHTPHAQPYEHGHEHGHEEHGDHHGEHGAVGETVQGLGLGEHPEELGEHPEEHGDLGHEAGGAESFALACFLMGGVAAQMFLFYLVNNKELETATWRVLNMTVSIFVAVLLYGTIKMTIIEFLKPDFYALIGITLAMFVLFFVGTHALLYSMMRGDPTQLRAAGTIMAHITGFAGMYGFADCKEIDFFEELSGFGILLLIMVTCFVIVSMCYVMDNIMDRTARASGGVDEDEELWMEICNETDDDVFCLAVSFLTVLYIRYQIRGHVMPYEPGKVGDVQQEHCTKLLLVSIAFALLVFAGQIVIMKYHEVLSSTEFNKRCVANLQHLNSMLMAWSFLFWAEWQLYVIGWERTVMGATLLLALLLTLLSFTGVVVFTFIREHLHKKLAKRAIGSLEVALGVLAGFSWERAFDVGFEEIEHAFAHQHGSLIPGYAAVTLLSFVLLCIVTPAWRYHILPKSMLLEETQEKKEDRFVDQ
jgi:hypothetical protein